MHRLPYDLNCSILLQEVPLLQRPQAARDAGFDAVEFWWPFPAAVPSDAEVSQFATAVRDAGVAVVGLNFAAGDMPGGDRGLVSWPGRDAEFRDSVDVAVGLGEALGVPAFNALYGNRIDGVRPQDQDELAQENLVFAAAAAARIGAVVLVEPVSGAPRYPLRTAAEAVAVIEAAGARGADNVRLLLDLYHLSVNGDDVPAAIAAHAARVGHVQVADAPGRHEPGSGDLDLDTHLEALEAAGYSGWVGLEYVPSTTTAASLNWLPVRRRSSASRAG